MTFPDRLATNFELVKQVPSNKPFDVFLVKDKTKNLRPCVLRLLPASLSGDKAIVDAFMAYFSKFSEIINRAYIPSVYSISGQAGGNVYVLEENVPGIDLRKFVQKHRNTPEFNREIISVIGKVCEALHHAHQKDIFHLAITPEDILIDEKTGRVKLVGFGVQVFAQINKTDLLYAQARKTIAPEVLTGDPLRPRADVYSLAKVINDICPEVFAGSDVLSKALSNNPDDRYQQARDFEGALNDVLEKISRPAPSRNIDTPLEAKGGLKPVLTEKPVMVERDSNEPRLPQTEINEDSVASVSSSIVKSASWKMIAGVAAGLIGLVVGLVLYFSHEKQTELAQIRSAQMLEALEKEKQNQLKKQELEGQEKERQEKARIEAELQAKEGQAALEKAKRDMAAEIARRKEAQRQADLYKEQLEREKQEKERLKAEQEKNQREKEEHDRNRRQELERMEREKREKAQKIERREKDEDLPSYAWNYPEDVKSLLRRAIKGDANAQRSIAEIYYEGKKIPRDVTEAIIWFWKADKFHHGASSLYPKDKDYFTSAEDMNKLLGFLRALAERGDHEAQYVLGKLYWENTPGLRTDMNKGVSWFLKSAEGGHPTACYDLGLSYLNGWGVPKDREKAILWMRKAVELFAYNADNVWREMNVR